jgi:hypothetical protein
MLSDEYKTMEAAVVGPDTRCQEEPNRAATTAGIIPAYKPYSGGMPAMVAKATPWGNTTIAPVRPAEKSVRNVPEFTFGHQTKKGNNRFMRIFIGTFIANQGEKIALLYSNKQHFAACLQIILFSVGKRFNYDHCYRRIIVQQSLSNPKITSSN